MKILSFVLAAALAGIIPAPETVTPGEGTFQVAGAAVCTDAALGKQAGAAVTEFAHRLSEASGVKSRVRKKARPGSIVFRLDATLPAEAYSLHIGPDGVLAKASSYNGVLYAICTLEQLLPEAVYVGKKDAAAVWELPCADIQDAPRFAYRGLHMDPSRHFWQLDEVKRYLDIMAVYKLNRMHWHLNDDQGWRVEIKALPRLTEVGSRREGTCIGKDFSSSDGIPYGGFYTQAQIREIVDYAALKGITIVPEIDLPGHMLAALASYPDLGCTGGPYAVWQRWGVADDVLCAGQEKTYEFLETVLGEICDMFPSEYIHIGGDECPKTRWKACPRCQAKIRELGLEDRGKVSKEQFLQNYVTSRMQQFLSTRGRRIIGWDEILEGDLAPGATVMSWRGTRGGIEASAKGFDVIMTPHTYLYFDYYQSGFREKEPFAIGGNLPCEKVYGYEPFDELDAQQQRHILGVQANLWTEYITTPEQLEYMLLPRLCALSEIQWSPAGGKDFSRFKESLPHQFRIFDTLGYTYSRDVFGIYGMR